MDANDPLFGYSPAGASGLFLGLSEFTEVRVLTQSFDVEYGRNGGGVIDAVTKSGTNQFHGSLFELHRDAALDSKNYFDLANAPIPPFVRNQFGAGAGGPLVHDRTFLYADYEGFREVQASTAIATVPDVLGRPFGMLDIAGMSLFGNSVEIPVGDLSTVYQVQDQLSRTTGGHTMIFGGEFQRIQSNGPLDFGVNGLYTFQDLSPFGIPAQT
ncbi:MAG: hypothetical protein WAL34_11605, partial [Acidobacteriaceae bacterium]